MIDWKWLALACALLTALITLTLYHAAWGDDLRWFQPTAPGTGQPIPNAPGALILTPHTTRPPGDTWIIPTIPGTSQIAPSASWGLILDLDDKGENDEDE